MRSRERIVSCDGILAGTPVVSGTRVPADTILAEVRSGRSPADILRHYPSLSPDDIDACVDWERRGRPACAIRSLSTSA